MQAQPDRLDRLEALLESLSRSTENLVKASENQQQRIDQHEQVINRHEENLLALQALGGRLSEQTLQLKRAVDYLLSKDGEN